MNSNLKEARSSFTKASATQATPRAYQNKLMARGLLNLTDYLQQLDERLRKIEKALEVDPE